MTSKSAPIFRACVKYGNGVAAARQGARYQSVSAASHAIQTTSKHRDVPANQYEKVLQSADYFGVRSLVTLKDLFRHQAYIGHKSGCRNPFMTPYLFGTRLDVDIFDLEKTLSHLQLALDFTAHMAYRNAVILFISRNKQVTHLVERLAVETGQYSHCRYWQGGYFTNSVSQFGSETRLPDVCVFINSLNNVFEPHRGIIDCAKMMIPTVGIVDSNCDPRLITYPVPANDDSLETVKYYLGLFKTALLAAKKKRVEDGLDKEELATGKGTA